MPERWFNLKRGVSKALLPFFFVGLEFLNPSFSKGYSHQNVDPDISYAFASSLSLNFGENEENQQIIAQELLKLINWYRNELSLTALSSWSLLEKAAQIRLEQIEAGFSHNTSKGGNALISTLMQLEVPSEWVYGEILGRTQASDPTEALNRAFLDSCSHRAYYGWGGARGVGMAGKWSSNGFFYFVAIFAGDEPASWPVC